MIKIERINAEKSTVLRNGVRQPLIVGMTVTSAELASIEAVTGSITYSVDESEIKELVFQPKPEIIPPVPKPAAKPAIKTAKPRVEPASKVTTED